MIRFAIFLIMTVTIGCGSPPAGVEAGNQDAGKLSQGAGQELELIGTWALVMDDPELAFEVLEDGTALGITMRFEADGVGVVGHGEGQTVPFAWSIGQRGVLTQSFQGEGADGREARYRVESVGEDRLRLVNVDFPESDTSIYLRR